MLYNTHLGTLIRVVEAGSFRRAAEQMRVSPSAVLKQIGLLETELGVSLFDRTRRGVTLTEAGESLYRDAKFIVRYCDEAGSRARESEIWTSSIVRMGCSPISPTAVLTRLWKKVHEKLPELRVHLISYYNTHADTTRMLHEIGRDIDIVPGFYDERFLKEYHLKALKLKELPVRIAVSRSHVLSRKERLTLGDLDGEKLLVPERGRNRAMDRLRDELEEKHPHIGIRDFDLFRADIFYSCQNEEGLMICTDIWEAASELLKILPVDWDYSMSYGLLYSPEPSEKTKRLLGAVEEILAE